MGSPESLLKISLEHRNLLAELFPERRKKTSEKLINFISFFFLLLRIIKEQ